MAFTGNVLWTAAYGEILAGADGVLYRSIVDERLGLPENKAMKPFL